MEITRLAKETDEYHARRDELQLAEIELMQQRERVAALRRALPEGTPVDDYTFLAGPPSLADGDDPVREVRLSDLFTSPDRALVIYHFMYGKAQTSPCPMCTMWIDGFNAVAHHLAENVDFVVLAAADPATLRAWARTRGWDRLRLLSAGTSTFKYDLASEDVDGAQDSTVSVFVQGEGGQLMHTYTGHPRMSDSIDQRGLDLLTPVWSVLDLTPQGRGDWYAGLDY